MHGKNMNFAFIKLYPISILWFVDPCSLFLHNVIKKLVKCINLQPQQMFKQKIVAAEPNLYTKSVNTKYWLPQNSSTKK
jgi:hypothetical protein